MGIRAPRANFKQQARWDIGMAWKVKLLEVIEDSKRMPILNVVFRHALPADGRFISDLQERCPFLDSDYIEFLSFTDGASFWMFEFCGSGASQMRALKDLARRWNPNVEALKLFPIGEAPSGDCIAIRESGEVVQLDYRADADAECASLARSFGELINDKLMGSEFLSLPDVPSLDRGGNEWVDYLLQKGWLSIGSA